MKREYKRDLQNNYLILEAPEIEEEESYALPMLERNSVRGLLQVHSSKREGIRCLHYEITSKQTLESLFEKKPMEYRDILMVLTGIRDAAKDLRRYLLSARRLLFAPDLIYVLPDGGGIRLCYYTQENICPISLLAEFILKKINHRDSAAVALGYGLYDQVGMENFSLDQTLQSLMASFGQSGQEQEDAVPDVCPSQSPLYIGKKNGDADIILPVPTVSRMHARIPMRGNACYVQDMNSKNGTFVNGRRLLGQEEAGIHQDDVITFAGVLYRAD